MKDVCLINPPLDKKTSSKFPMSGVPLGIASLAAYVRERKISVAVIDSPIMDWDFDRTAVEAIRTGAKIIGISCLTENRYSALKTLKRIKKRAPKVTTLIGGLHATFSDKMLLENYPYVDIVVRGEGEQILEELVKKIKQKKSIKKVKGITYRNGKEIVINEPRQFLKEIESLPLPAYDLFPVEKYPLPPDIKGKIKQTILVTTSRGCPMNCKFCETTHAWGRNIRSASAEKLYNQVEFLHKKYGVDYIRFADDLFTMKRTKVVDFCNLVIKNKLPIKFRIQARVDTVDQEELHLLKKAGCDLIEYGAESGSNKVLKEVGKNITLEKIKKASEMTRKAGIELKYFLIVGSLKETPKDTWKTFQLIKQTKPDWIGINALTIYPGTEVFNIAEKEGLIDKDLWLNYLNPQTGNAPLYTKYYTDKEMIFLSQLGHVWSCRNSPARKYYPKIERILAFMITESLAKIFVKNKIVRKIGAQFAWVVSPFIS